VSDYEAIRDQTLDDECYRWLRLNVMRVRALIRHWDDSMTPQHFDGVVRDAMRDFPEPEA